MTALVVGLCGGLGAILRFLVDTGVRRLWPTAFPVGTLLVNVTGSFVFGVVTAAAVHADVAEVVRVAAAVGFCGGYTTFSTAMFETVELVRRRRFSYACGYLAGLPVVCLAGAALGYAIG